MVFDLANQTYAIIALGIIQILILTKSSRSFRKYLFYFIILVSLFTIVNAYNINCLVKGNCNVWAWIIVALTVISVASSYLAAQQINEFIDNLNKDNKDNKE